jgi:Spy/CpxP family protein refolding chaperone
MKKLLMIAAIFTMTFAGANAQRGQGGPRGGQQKESMTPEQRAEKITTKMTEELGLSEDQKQKIYQVNLENAKKRDANRATMEEERKAKRTEMQAQNQAQNEQIEAILTPEQKTKWEEVKKENRKEIRERSGSGRGQRGGKGGSGSRGGSSTK